MSLLDKLKAILSGSSGRERTAKNAGQRRTGSTAVADASTERTVKEPSESPTSDVSSTATDTPSTGTTSQPGSNGAGEPDLADQTPETTAGVDSGSDADEAFDDGASSDTESDRSEAAEDERGDERAVSEINGIGPAYSERLEAIGIESVDDLANADPENIADETDISIGRVSNWIERARAA